MGSAAICKRHRLSGLQTTDTTSHTPRGLEFGIWISARWVEPLAEPSSSLQPLGFSWDPCPEEHRAQQLSPECQKGLGPSYKGSTLLTSSNPKHLPKVPSPDTITLGVELIHRASGDTNVQPVIMCLPRASLGLLVPP